jgi:hypothetical protein
MIGGVVSWRYFQGRGKFSGRLRFRTRTFRPFHKFRLYTHQDVNGDTQFPLRWIINPHDLTSLFKILKVTGLEVAYDAHLPAVEVVLKIVPRRGLRYSPFRIHSELRQSIRGIWNRNNESGLAAITWPVLGGDHFYSKIPNVWFLGWTFPTKARFLPI